MTQGDTSNHAIRYRFAGNSFVAADGTRRSRALPKRLSTERRPCPARVPFPVSRPRSLAPRAARRPPDVPGTASRPTSLAPRATPRATPRAGRPRGGDWRRSVAEGSAEGWRLVAIGGRGVGRGVSTAGDRWPRGRPRGLNWWRSVAEGSAEGSGLAAIGGRGAAAPRRSEDCRSGARSSSPREPFRRATDNAAASDPHDCSGGEVRPSMPKSRRVRSPQNGGQRGAQRPARQSEPSTTGISEVPGTSTAEGLTPSSFETRAPVCLRGAKKRARGGVEAPLQLF